jgi:D-glycero-D-manno-heptose 1,7-bisphosphate phosphatase
MKNKALFLDRDGVINVEKNYVYKIEDFEFVEGIFDTLKIYNQAGHILIIITNQAGIGRGYYSEEAFNKLNSWMLKVFQDRGVHIHKVYYCPCHPEFGLGKYKQDCSFRKPKPGMILQAAKEFNIDLANSILVGDKGTDIKAGINAGVGKNILLTNEQNDKYKHVISSIKELAQYAK